MKKIDQLRKEIRLLSRVRPSTDYASRTVFVAITRRLNRAVEAVEASGDMRLLRDIENLIEEAKTAEAVEMRQTGEI